VAGEFGSGRRSVNFIDPDLTLISLKSARKERPNLSKAKNLLYIVLVSGRCNSKMITTYGKSVASPPDSCNYMHARPGRYVQVEVRLPHQLAHGIVAMCSKR
jgi:hypothetical protein